MKLTFWGTRGSIAKPGPDTVRYGGNTSCVQLESDGGTLVVLDCGTGAHELGQSLARGPGPVRGHILIGHTHWDHIQGIPFFAPLFNPENTWDFYAPQGFGESVQETLAGQMQYTYFPITMDALGAKVHYHNLVEGEFRIDDIKVRTRYLNHTALTLGFRLEVDGVVVVYACDHEPHSRDLAVEPDKLTGQDRDHAEFLRDADLVIHDAQYTIEEYPHKVGWGHSTADYAVAVCRSVGVKRVALTHHDPLRDDDGVDELLKGVLARLDDGGPDIEVFAAAEGQVIELKRDRTSDGRETEASPALQPEASLDERTVLLGAPDTDDIGPIIEAARADDLDLVRCGDAEETIRCYRDVRPDLVMLHEALGPGGGLEVAQAIRAVGDAHSGKVPVILVAGHPPDDDGNGDAATDVLTVPFSVQYARSRIRAWLLRTRCRWVRPPVPADEKERLAALRECCLLDSEPEERFDRITRLVSAVFEVPVALITLIDKDRQWFKSRVGTTDTESSREVSFCAHAINSDEPLVVPDALRDDRFADNPAVSGPPRIRFYAGQPVRLPSGHRAGTLCAIDTRPHRPTPEQMRHLADLAALVERELATPPGKQA